MAKIISVHSYRGGTGTSNVTSMTGRDSDAEDAFGRERGVPPPGGRGYAARP